MENLGLMFNLHLIATQIKFGRVDMPQVTGSYQK